MQRPNAQPSIHGRDHQPGGADPIPSEWIYVGDGGDPDAPDFQNSWVNSGGSYAPMRFRFLPHKDLDSGQPGVQIQGSVTGGAAGTVIFTLPITLDYDVHLAASDDTGAFICITVQQSGDVVAGFV